MYVGFSYPMFKAIISLKVSSYIIEIFSKLNILRELDQSIKLKFLYN